MNKWYKMILTVVIANALLLVAHAEEDTSPHYFMPSGSNAATGMVLGESVNGNPATWGALHSELSATLYSGKLRIVGRDQAGVSFLWTREKGDDSPYLLTPVFSGRMEFEGAIRMQVGFDFVYMREQGKWPKGYWQVNNAMWNDPFPIAEADSGSFELNPEDTSFYVPSTVQKVYIRLSLERVSGQGKFAWIDSGSVEFTPVARDYQIADQEVEEVRNVLDFGADPTGLEDSTEAIQCALDEGGTIFIPAGEYKITRTLSIEKSFTEIRGEAGSIIKVAASHPVSAIETSWKLGIWGLTNLVIRDLYLDNDVENFAVGENRQHTRGLSICFAREVRIDNVHVRNFQHDGIIIYSSKNVLINGCVVDGPRHGITVNGQYAGGRYGNWNVQVTNCRTTNTWDTGIIVGFYSYYVVLDGNVVERSRCHGIDIFNTEHVVISNNIVHNWLSPHYVDPVFKRAVGIFVHPDWGITTYAPTGDITITGNQVVFDGELKDGVAPQAIEITGNVDGVVVTDNLIDGGFDGFFLREQPYDGYFERRSDQRKAVSNAPRNVVFSNNICRGQRGRILWLNGDSQIPALITNNLWVPGAGGRFEVKRVLEASPATIFRNNMIRGSAGIRSELSEPAISSNWLFSSSD